MTAALPIDSVLPELIRALQRSPSLVLSAPTGAGKTTRVPPALLDAGLANGKRLLMLEPRRLAARAAARRMAQERGGRVGEEVGYHVRFDRRAGPRTQVLIVTPGILLRELQTDPLLEGTGLVIFDEFHERGLDSDLALGMVRLLQQTVRDDLRLVVMSATLATKTVSAYLDHCPVVAAEGRLHPVDILHTPRPEARALPAAIAGAVQRLLDDTDGEVLVFLPGMLEIRQAARALESVARTRHLHIVTLHGDLPAHRQDAALLPLDRRKVVLATNVAETSVTVEGITGVVDSGLARVLRFDPATGLDRLTREPIARASADQRAGRAGRTHPGICIRLWSREEHRLRPADGDPEIHRVDLAGAVLQLLALGERNLDSFPWFEPPTPARVEAALSLLRRLGALEDSESPGRSDMQLTPLGHAMARLPVHPRLARLLLEGHRLGVLPRAALAAALLSERDPWIRGGAVEAVATTTRSDLLVRMEQLEAFATRRVDDRSKSSLDPAAARFVLQARDQLMRLAADCQPTPPPPGAGRVGDPPSRKNRDDDRLLRALVPAFADRLARRRERASDRAVMVGGRGVRLAGTSGVHEGELFLCLELEDGAGEALVRQASLVERGWLPDALLHTDVEVRFDEANEQIVARRVVRFDDLQLEETATELPADQQVSSSLAEAAATRLERVLPPEDSPAAKFLTRLRCLRAWRPELSLPEFDQVMMRSLLPQVCQGRRSFAEVRDGWLEVVRRPLTPIQRQTVEREAPERLTIPSGSRIALEYAPGRPPVLAARLQELFGLRETPRVAGGRVPVLLHLLAPNFRPQQVTDDLASFWTNVYPRVRSELRRRYPKHAWPEDPWTAEPVRGAKRRKP